MTLLNSPHPLVEVYLLAKNEWIMLRKPCPMCCTIRDLEPPAFVNGAVDWVAFQSTNSNDHIEKSPTFILAFDLEEEVFREILQP